MDVRGNLGFMDGLRLMVPVVGKSHSNATSQHDEGAPPSLIQPLELELEALLRDESLRRNRGPVRGLTISTQQLKKVAEFTSIIYRNFCLPGYCPLRVHPWK